MSVSTSHQGQPADLSLNKYSLEYSYKELEKATRSFSNESCLGRGAFGAVYRGIQADGTDVAIKALDAPKKSGFEEEVRVLSKFRHPNLVILIGFARRGEQRFLVYELLEGGDVYRRLARCNKQPELMPFTWRERVSAMFDAACGLSHLHNSNPRVFHRDIKSANILLDRNGTAKVADFGLACLSQTNTYTVENAAGTVGYACPLYAKTKVVTEASESYSFGIVLLEILTCSPPAWTVSNHDGKPRYQFLVTRIQNDVNRVLSLADPNASWPITVATALADLALRCTNICEDMRANFVQMVSELRPLVSAPDFLQERPSVEHVSSGMPGCAQRSKSCQVASQQGAVDSLLEVVESVPSALRVAECKSFDVKPLLWSLVCTFAETASSISGRPDSDLRLEHRQSHHMVGLHDMTVGRKTHEDFLYGLISCEANRGTISREHFQIVAKPLKPVSASALERVPCAFFLANLGRNWTMVNDNLLSVCGQYTRVHHGDLISLGRNIATDDGLRYCTFLQFRFELTGSILDDSVATGGNGHGLELKEDQPADARSFLRAADGGA